MVEERDTCETFKTAVAQGTVNERMSYEWKVRLIDASARIVKKIEHGVYSYSVAGYPGALSEHDAWKNAWEKIAPAWVEANAEQIGHETWPGTQAEQAITSKDSGLYLVIAGLYHLTKFAGVLLIALKIGMGLEDVLHAPIGIKDSLPEPGTFAAPFVALSDIIFGVVGCLILILWIAKISIANSGKAMRQSP